MRRSINVGFLMTYSRIISFTSSKVLKVWLAATKKINYSVQDNDILMVIEFRPDAASRDDCREKFTPAQNLNYTRRRAELAAQ